MSSPPAKRQRTENAPVTRSDIWYEDGSVVLQAQNIQFRVHWGVLTQHSTFFCDMQGLPQPADQPSVDGCPIVELQDAAVDVEYLLKVLYSLSFLSQKTLPLSAVAAFIRLGRKYDFREVLDAAMERFMFENPTTLEEYDARLLSGGGYVPTRIAASDTVVIDMLALAREHDIMAALPCTYYRVVKYRTLTQLLDGQPTRDGPTASLALADQRQCILARDRLLKGQIQPGYTFGWTLHWKFGHCTDPAMVCATTRNSASRKLLGTMVVSALNPSWRGTALCTACATHLQEEMIAGRKKMWEELPSFFDLPPWSELKNHL